MYNVHTLIESLNRVMLQLRSASNNFLQVQVIKKNLEANICQYKTTLSWCTMCGYLCFQDVKQLFEACIAHVS